MGVISEVIDAINTLLSATVAETDLQLSELLRDGKRVLLKYIQIADVAPLQLYCAGLAFTPGNSIIRRTFIKELPSWLCRLPKVEETWSALQLNLEGHSYAVNSVAFCPGGRLLASGSSDGTINLWDTVTGALQQTLEEDHLSPVFSVAFCPGGRFLASGNNDETVKLWDTATGAVQQTLEGHSDRVQSVAFSSDGHLLASGSHDKTVKLWDTATGALKQTLTGHLEEIQSVAFSSDGRLLASGSWDNTVKLWNTATGALQQTLAIGEVVTNLKFCEDSPYLNTNLGLLKIQPWHNDYTSNLSKGNTQEVFIRDNWWVTIQGKDVMWVPPEYRPTCSTFKMDGTFVLGHSYGRISFIRVLA